MKKIKRDKPYVRIDQVVYRKLLRDQKRLEEIKNALVPLYKTMMPFYKILKQTKWFLPSESGSSPFSQVKTVRFGSENSLKAHGHSEQRAMGEAR